MRFYYKAGMYALGNFIIGLAGARVQNDDNTSTLITTKNTMGV